MDDDRSNYERMLAGDPYISDDPRIWTEQQRALTLSTRFNAEYPVDPLGAQSTARELFGHLGDGAFIRGPLFVDYGYNISIGDHTFVNYNLTALDVAPITIGAHCQIATAVQLLTATHPLDAELRRAGWESAEPISIGNNVWLGGGVIVCPGVTIGDDTVIGAGSVVTKDVPANCLAVGNPARVIRQL